MRSHDTTTSRASGCRTGQTRSAGRHGLASSGRIGHPDDIAAAFEAVLTDAFITGTVRHVDGGHRLV